MGERNGYKLPVGAGVMGLWDSQACGCLGDGSMGTYRHLYCYEMPPLVVAMLTETHQHWIMISYMALGQPGGGGRRYPRSTCFIDYKISQ